MELEGFTALPECSRKAQTTPDRGRYWLKLLGVETVKKGNVRYVPNAAADLLGNMARLISNGMTPGEAAKKAKDETPFEIAPVKVSEVPGKDTARLEGIEKAMLAMAEQMKNMVEENRSLRSEILTMQKAIEYKQPEPIAPKVEPVKPITPTIQKTAAPIRAVIFEPTQRSVSSWDSLRSVFDDFFGFAFGKG